MRGKHGISAAVMLASFATLRCGAPPAQLEQQGSVVSLRTGQQIEGSFEQDDHLIRFAAHGTAPLAGDVRVDIGALRYDVHYEFEDHEFEDHEFEDHDLADHDLENHDFAAGLVVADGHGGALEYEAQRPLLEAIAAVSTDLQLAHRETPLHERMLHAALGMLRDSGGMPLEQKTFELGPAEEVDKSIDDDGISCIESGEIYYVSFDFGDTTVSDGEIQAGVHECNGQCGPYCTQLQPWRMWTLDCLEHDACCNMTSDDACWTPLGECGDEYDAAMGDFLRGYAPFSRHCGG